jgi:hypothetical protein
MRILFLVTFILSSNVLATVNKVKGNIAECVYERLNPTIGKIHGEYNAVNGIDHVFLKRSGNKIVDCMIVDSKFGSAKLAKDRENWETGEKELEQLSLKHLDQILDRLENGNYQNPPGLMSAKDAQNIVKAQARGDYTQLRKMIQNGQCKKRVFNLQIDQYGHTYTEYKIVEDIDDKRVKTRPAKGGERTLYDRKKNHPKVNNFFRECFAEQMCIEKRSKFCIPNMIKKLEKNPAQYHKILEKRYPAEKIKRMSQFFPNEEMYKSAKKLSLKEYDEIAKKINKRAFASPALLASDGKLITSISGGFSSGIAVIGIEGGMAYYDYLEGDIYKNEFHQKVMGSAIKGMAVGGSEALVMFLMETPHGLVLLGAGVGAYIIVDNTLKTYKYYKEKHFLNADDLKVYGIELDSVLDIHDDGVPLNIENW